MSTHTIYIPESNVSQSQPFSIKPKGYLKSQCAFTHKSIGDSLCYTAAHNRLDPEYTYYHTHYSNAEFKQMIVQYETDKARVDKRHSYQNFMLILLAIFLLGLGCIAIYRIIKD